MGNKDNKSFTALYDTILDSKELSWVEKVFLCLLIRYTKYKGEIYDTNAETYANKMNCSVNTIRSTIGKLRDIGYISTKKIICKGQYKPLHIQVNKEKVNNDFGWHIFTDIKQSNVKENTNCNVGNLENIKNVCKFTETYSNAEQRRIRDELAKKRRDAKAEIN